MTGSTIIPTPIGSGSWRWRRASSPRCAPGSIRQRLSPAGRLSFRLFEEEVTRDRASFRWRWHGFPATNNGSPMGALPVFLINNHRVDTVADAEAYVSRLREVERVMGEISANIRHQAELGIVPPAFNFEPVREPTAAASSPARRSPTGRTTRCSPISRPR